MTLLQATRIGYRAGDKQILREVDLSLAGGETVAVVGPNGAGKTTLLRTLSGELSPTQGNVLLRGRNVRAYSASELAQHRSVLSQHVSVAFPFTVREIVGMGAGGGSGKRFEAMVSQALAEVGLTDLGHRVITTLSGGEQQRAHFARILVQVATGEAMHGPGLVLLDEPTASLDLKHQLALAEAARRFARRGVAVLAIVHDLNLAALMADRVAVLANGRLVLDGAPAHAISEQMLSDVFGVAQAVSRVPQSAPFVLPHQAVVVAPPDAK